MGRAFVKSGNIKQDKIYSHPLEQLVDFNFDEKVANVFPDMINRSVPGYASIVAMSGILAAEFYQENSNCYDLGCSLGASALSMAKAIKKSGHCLKAKHIIAIDNSQAMLDKASQLIANNEFDSVYNDEIDFQYADINQIELSHASVVVMNFTLQFIAPEKRLNLLEKIYQAMNQGAILILSEKIAYDHQAQDQLLIDMHHYFKKANGYSDLEISQKRQSLEKVLLPESLEQHKQRLTSIGFLQVEQWFQCFNFSSLIAIK